ncbi:helix-turn-helix domain-containing protein [Brunnivagina elsteri]|nr:helix-turn-helix domain-containing protein [Calothrix elsteri]
MKTSFLSRFTPSSMSAETLEKIFVKRHDLADDLVDAIRESATSENKHFRLLVGMRGIGKTHLVSLVYHRISQMEDLRDKLVIAWLREEEWGIDSFLSLLQRIFRVIKEEYPDEYNQTLNLEVESLYELSPENAEFKAASLLKEFIGKRTLLIIAENLDILFQGLDDIGQKQLRAYIQNYSFISILATSQSLFDGIKRQDDPFYGFFYPYFLETLQINEAVDLLTQIVELEGDSELKSFIRTVAGYSRIRVIHHLAGGNPRIYVIFSQFITRKSLDELVEPFMQMLDDLTPYYQTKMQYLSPQQRKIIEFLVERRHPVIMTEIAKRCFISEQITSGQLKELCSKGYVCLEKIGSESFYELREPLMRFCLEVKKQREESIRLFVDFLRCWYTKEELQQRLGMKSETITNGFTTNDAQAGLSMGLARDLTSNYSDTREDFNYRIKALPEDAVMEHEYIMKALEEMDMEEEDNPRFVAYRKEFDGFWEKEDYTDALKYAKKLVENRGDSQDWVLQGHCLNREHPTFYLASKD